MERALGLLLAILLTLGGVLAEDMHTRMWNSYVGFASPYVVPLPSGELTRADSRRVILLVVRGLTAREATQMPALNALRERGAHATLKLTPPTFATPAWLTLLTGASPETHGALTDKGRLAPGLDTLFERVSSSGNVGALLATESIVKRFTPGPQLNDVFDDVDSAEHDAGVITALAQNLRTPNAPERLLVAELAMLDTPRSPGDDAARAMAIAAVDIRIEAIAGAVDQQLDTLIIIGDRGRAPDGAEGGDEFDVAQIPLMLAGAGIQPGTQTLGAMTDVAPTIAILLGIPIPSHAQGVPLWDLVTSQSFVTSARQLTTFYEMWSEVVGQNRFAAELLRGYEADIAAGARPRFEMWYAALMQTVTDTRNAALASEQAARMPIVLLLAAAIAAAVYFILDQNAQPSLIGAGLFLGALVFDALFIRGLRPTLSLFTQSGESQVLAVLSRDAALAYLAVGVIASVIATLTCETYGEALLATMGALTIAASCCAVVGLWFYMRWGDAFTLFLPDQTSFVTAQIALRGVAALSIPVVEGWPSIPIPLLALVPSLLSWNLFGGRFIRA